MPPPPLLQYFLPLHLHLQVISTMRRPFQAIYVGVRSPLPPPLAGPLTPPPLPPPTLKVARKREGVGIWPVAATPPRDKTCTLLSCVAEMHHCQESTKVTRV